MKRYLLLVILLIAISSISGFAIAKDSPQTKNSATNTDGSSSGDSSVGVRLSVPGSIFTGDYIRIGINDGGTLGVGSSEPGVGIQSSSDGSTESIAVGTWLEGYNVAYNDGTNKVGYWYPALGYPPSTSSNIVIVSNSVVQNDNDKAIKKTVVKTGDNKLIMTFTWTFMKRYPYVLLDTNIKNNANMQLKNVVYKRMADFDVCGNFDNSFSSSSDSAYAQTNCQNLGNAQLTIAEKGASYVDLYSWDDLQSISPGYIDHSIVPINGDEAPAVYYTIGNLDYGKSVTINTVYQAYFPPISTVIATTS